MKTDKPDALLPGAAPRRAAGETEEAVKAFRMDELEAVMLSVDKWFDEGDPRLENNPATRAADAREIALRAIEEAARDAIYHRDCRPNRRKAEAAMADAKAMNDKWADEVKARRDAETELAQLRTAVRRLTDQWENEIKGYLAGTMLPSPVGDMNRASADVARRILKELKQIAGVERAT